MVIKKGSIPMWQMRERVLLITGSSGYQFNNKNRGFNEETYNLIPTTSHCFNNGATPLADTKAQGT
jgi:hypothetical protein